MYSDNNKYQLKGLNLSELTDYFVSINEPKFRGKQVFDWMYNHLSTDFDEMLNLSIPLREKLKVLCELQSLKITQVQNSKSTETKKYLFQTTDLKNIESVVIPDKDRNTLCISTQVGCPLDCKFCATGLMGYKRNLTTGEIVDQYFMAQKENRENPITNIVYMGMGEPLLNFNNTLKSLKIFTSELANPIGRNRITVSTSGIPHKIKEMADNEIRVKLALSLHSCDEKIRSKIMPINDKYSLTENIDAIQYYLDKTKTKVTFEYTMLKDVNDREADIRLLTNLCKRLSAKINIIPFNSIAHMAPEGISKELIPTSKTQISKFVEKLRNNNITVMVRETQGDDIAAACGQLAVKY